MNRHKKFELICKEIDYEMKNFIIYEENGEMFYGKKYGQEVLKNRSVNEIVYKPFFMKKLRDKLSGIYDPYELIDIEYNLLYINCGDIEKYLFNILKIGN